MRGNVHADQGAAETDPRDGLMVQPEIFLTQLQDAGISFYTGVPDSLLKGFCACLSEHSEARQHYVAANEGGALALGLGYYLSTGRLPLIYLQNSGLGNLINPLLSLADPDIYSIPMLLLIGWRGEPGTKDEPQHLKQGKTTLSLLDAMGIPYSILAPSLEDAAPTIAHAVHMARECSSPYALVVKKGTFGKSDALAVCERTHSLSREDSIKLIVDSLTERDIVVSTTGMASRELFEYRECLGHGHERDFLTVGGMGHASQIALGIALQKTNRQVVCIDGDGALLMHLGAMAINGTANCSNFKHIVLNNGAHDSVGGQPTVALSVNLATVARALGYRTAFSAETTEETSDGLASLLQHDGPGFLEIKVRGGSRSDLGRPTISPLENKERFMEYLC